MSVRSLNDAVVNTAAETLTAAGWRKRSGPLFTRKLDADVLGWIGLNTSSRREPLMVNVQVGVRHLPLETRVAELRGEKVHAYKPPTISIHVGYLTPEERHAPLYVSGEGDLSEFAERLRSMLSEHVDGFLEEHRGLEAITQRLGETGYGIREHVYYRRPVALLLLDRPQEARDYVAAELEELGQRQDPAAARFRAFTDAFVKHVDALDEVC